MITRVQSFKGGTVGGNTITITLGAAPTNGNGLILGVARLIGTVPAVNSITQTGVTWVRRATVANPLIPEIEVWDGLNASSAGTTITITYIAGGQPGEAIGAEYSGIRTNSAIDKFATDGNSMGSPVITGTTATTTQANEVWVGFVASLTAGGISFGTPTNGFAEVDHTTNANMIFAMEEKIVSSVGTASTSVPISGALGTETGAGIMTTYKSFTLSTVHNLSLLGVGS